MSRTNLQDGLKAASEQKFDLYLLDLWLPDGSGLDPCKKIREFDVKTPVVFYSAAAYEVIEKPRLAAAARITLSNPPTLLFCAPDSFSFSQDISCRDADS